jgi:hypothetical protein
LAKANVAKGSVLCRRSSNNFRSGEPGAGSMPAARSMASGWRANSARVCGKL